MGPRAAIKGDLVEIVSCASDKRAYPTRVGLKIILTIFNDAPKMILF